MLTLRMVPSVAGMAMIVSAPRRRLANLRLSTLRHIMVLPFQVIITPVTLPLVLLGSTRAPIRNKGWSTNEVYEDLPEI